MLPSPRTLRFSGVLVAAILVAACTSNATPGPSTGGGGGGGLPSGGPISSGGGASGGTEDLSGQSVTVLGTWGGDEETAFRNMVKPWEQKTGATMKYTGSRNLNQDISRAIQSGTKPADLAGLPGPGQMQEYAAAGALVDLSSVLDTATYQSETAKALADLGVVDGKIVGVFIKSAVKGLIWYNPKTVDFSSAPSSWDALQQAISANKDKAEKPWCLGVESKEASGWPGTDWIEDLVLRQSGPDVYNSWWQGKTKWTDPAIKQAWQVFGDVVANSFGGNTGVNATNFEVAGDPLFKTPPGCLVFHQASFITGLGQFKSKTAGTDYNFFPFPDINTQFTGALEGAGDLFGMFNDTPASRSLMKYLVTAEAQDIWVKAGGALSANKNATSYPDDISKRSADMLQNAKIFVFDASDLMPQEMNQAFWKGVVDYVKNPGSLDSILSNLDNVQSGAYTQ